MAVWDILRFGVQICRLNLRRIFCRANRISWRVGAGLVGTSGSKAGAKCGPQTSHQFNCGMYVTQRLHSRKKTSYRIGFKNISLIRFRVTNALFQRHVKRLFCTVFCEDFGGILSIQVSPVIQNKPSRLVLSWLYYIAPMYIYNYIVIIIHCMSMSKFNKQL